MVRVPGGRVWYQIQGANSKGVPVLTLHGGPGVPHDYLEPLSALSSERPVVFYDQLGCGNSDKPEDESLWTVRRYVDELAIVRKSLGLDNVHLLGHSWGTMLAVDYMLRKRPKGVVSMVLSGPALSAARWTTDTRAYLKRMPRSIQKTIRENEKAGTYDSAEYQEAMAAFYKKHLCRIDPWPDCLNRAFQKLAQPVYSLMMGASEFTFTGSLKSYERADRLKDIDLPVLFTAGQFDEASPKTTRYYQSKLPGSEIHVFKGASHVHHIEREKEYLGVVRDFCGRSERQRKESRAKS
jgi:proline iminopeptidase